MKKFLLPLLICLLMFGILGCQINTAELYVKGVLYSIKHLDEGDVAGYINKGYFGDSIKTSSNRDVVEKTIPILVEKFSYDVLGSTEKTDLTEVRAKITNVNMNKLVGQTFIKLSPTILQNFAGKVTTEELKNKFVDTTREYVRNDSVEMASNEVTFKVRKSGNDFEITNFEDISESMFGSFMGYFIKQKFK